MARHFKQPVQAEVSSPGRLVIGEPIIMAACGHTASQGLHGMSWSHSITAIRPLS